MSVLLFDLRLTRFASVVVSTVTDEFSMTAALGGCRGSGTPTNEFYKTVVLTQLICSEVKQSFVSPGV